VKPFFLASLIAASIFTWCFAEHIVGVSQGLTEEISPVINWLPDPVKNGNVILLEINTQKIDQPIFGIQAKFQKQMILISRHLSGARGSYFGLIAIPYHQKPGPITVKLEWTNPRGYHSQIITSRIIVGKYKSEKFKVDPRMINPSNAERDRARREREEIGHIYYFSNPWPLWDSPFQLPVNTRVTSPFGAKRLLNGKVKSFHSGVDFRANTRTSVRAANAGIVKLAKHLFYAGNHVIIDHGLGIFTSYSHMSKISVTVGQRVEKGQSIGRAGASGRVNGPHLHWGAKVNRISVNPLQLVEALSPLFPVLNDPS
jgi:hypothetical protein